MVVQVHHVSMTGERMVARRSVNRTSLGNRFDALSSKSRMLLRRLKAELIGKDTTIRRLLTLVEIDMDDSDSDDDDDDEDKEELFMMWLSMRKSRGDLRRCIYRMFYTAQAYRQSHHIIYSNNLDLSTQRDQWFRHHTKFT